jgi:hypothetical protein
MEDPMRRRCVGLVAGAVIAWVAGLPADAGAQTAVVSGIVLDAGTHARVPFAVVTVVGTSLSDTTGVDGSYRIAGVPLGPQTFEALRAGFMPGSSGCRQIAASSDSARVAIPIAALGSDTTPLSTGYGVSLSPVIGRVAGRDIRAAGGGRYVVVSPIGSVRSETPTYIVDGLVFPAGHLPTRALSQVSDRIDRVDVDRSPEAVTASGVCSATSVITVRIRPTGR